MITKHKQKSQKARASTKPAWGRYSTMMKQKIIINSKKLQNKDRRRQTPRVNVPRPLPSETVNKLFLVLTSTPSIKHKD